MIERNLTPEKLQKLIDERIDYQHCAMEVFKKLRGSVSQRQLSSTLGFSYNQVGKWESGVTQIKWDDFIHLCEIQQVPIENNFRRMFWTFEGEFTPARALTELSKNLNLSLQYQQKYSLKIKKWVSGALSPDLAEVLEIIDRVPAMLIGFLTCLIDCSDISALRSRYEHYMIQLELVHQNPVSVFVNAALQLEEYQSLPAHNEVILAYHSTCSIEHLRGLLHIMLTCGLITFDENKYHPCPFDFSFSGVPHAKLRGLTKYVTDLASKRYILQPSAKSPTGIEKNASVSSVRVDALSKKAAKKLMDLVSEFHNNVSRIILEDIENPKNNIQVVLIHSFASTINSEPGNN